MLGSRFKDALCIYSQPKVKINVMEDYIEIQHRKKSAIWNGMEIVKKLLKKQFKNVY